MMQYIAFAIYRDTKRSSLVMKSYKFMPKKGLVEEVKPEEFFLSWHLFAEDYKSIWKKEQVGNAF